MASKREGRSLLTRNIKLLLSWTLLNSILIGYMNVVPLVYLLEVGYNPSVLGSIYAVAAIANTIAYIPFGILADRYGRKIFLIVGGMIPSVSYAIFGLTLNPYWLIVAGILGGVGFAGGLAVAISSPALLPLMAGSSSDKNRNLIFGLTQGAFIIALTIGSLLSFLPSILESNFSLDSHAAHSISYFFMSALILISTVPALFIKEENLRVKASLTDSKRMSRILPIVSRKAIFQFSIVFALTGLGLGAIIQLLPTWFNLQYGASETTAGLWIAIAELVSVIAIPLIPWMVKRRGTVLMASVTLAFSCLFLGVMPLAGFFLLAALLYVVRSVLVNVSWPTLQSYMMGIVKERERATTIGITYTAWGLATSIGTFVGGDLLGSRLLWVPFVIGAGGYLAASVIFFMFFRKKKPPEEEREIPPQRIG